MYNRYMNSAGDESEYFTPIDVEAQPVSEIPVDADIDKEKPKGLGALKNLFGGNVKLPELDADTILLLVLVYFLIADSNENMTDTILIIGALLLLGF